MIDVCTQFNMPGRTEYCGQLQAVRSIQLPDGTSYSFEYDSGTTAGHYGLLTKMIFPCVGQITYLYNNFSDSYGNPSRWITGRTTPDGTWSYGGPSVINSCSSGQVNCQQKVTVTKPSGDSAVYTFTLNGGAWPTQQQTYNGSVSPANLLSTTTACYSFVTVTNGQCSYNVTTASPANNVHKTAQTTTLPIPGSSVSTTTQYTWDRNNYGNLMKLQEWNFGSSTSGNADRTTNIAYLGGTNYVTANILNRPSTVTVTDKNNNTVSQSVYCYDDNSNGGGCGAPNIGSSPANIQNHDDTNYGASNAHRGNLTQLKRYFSTSAYLTTSMTYDMTGQISTSKDSYGNPTTYSYTDHFFDDNNSNPPAPHSTSTATNAYVTTITPPGGSSMATTFGYYYGTGQLAKVTDPNSNTTYSHFYESLNRPTATSLPNTGWTLNQYNSTDTQVDSYTGFAGTSGSGCTTCRHDETKLDGLGRPVNSYFVNDPDGQTKVDTQFDSNGRVKTVSNPYRTLSDPTYGLETPTYDGLDRTSKVTHADGNAVYVYYGAAITSALGQTTQQCSSSTYGSGYPVLNVDEVGNKRQTWTDGFGRLIEADEPDSTGALNKKTCSTYDQNNNLTGVLATDGSQTRSFSYDMLSRLTAKTEPEPEPSAPTYFYYTTSGGGLCSGDPSAICRRTDGRNITTTYTYDTMNRLTSKSYNDSSPTTPTVNYYYDQSTYNGLTVTNGKGRNTGMSDGSGQTAWSYDSLGSVLVEKKTINSQTRTINYTYNLDGSIHTIQYPGARTVTYAESNAQRMTAAQDIANSINYVISATYGPQGALASVQNGSSLVSTMFYDNRLELCRISVKNTGTAPANCPSTTTGNVLDLAYGHASGNNGNIATQTNMITNARTQTYTYDLLNRLLTAQSAATSGTDCLGQSFTDDILNNQLSVTATKCSTGAPNWSVNSHNEITNTGFGYGNSGDNTADGNYTYSFDAENRMISAVTGSGTYCYAYDGDDLRVQKGHGTCTSPTVDKLYWRETSGGTIAETDGTGSTTNSGYNEYVFFAGQRIAQANPSSGNVYYYFSDYLGSTRVVTNATGSPCYEADFLPYGSENTPASFTNTCSTSYKFTGYERDPETNNDYAFARYYSPRLERFLSPDPIGGGITDPQTLNKYTYARNNPVNLVDPSGLCESGDPGDPMDPSCGCDPFSIGIGCGCNLYICGDPCLPFGCGGGGEGGGGGFPVQPPPPGASDASAGSLVFGCESLGMPCGMQFPVVGGVNSPGCDFGACGPSGNGFLPGIVLAGAGCAIVEPCGISVGAGTLITLGLGTAAALAAYLWSRSHPWKGTPGSTTTTDTTKGDAKQARRYGSDGYPDTDVDYDHDHGAGRPHAHDIGRPADGSPPTAADRGPGRPIKPSDPFHPKAKP